jgi:hypothetical protein
MNFTRVLYDETEGLYDAHVLSKARKAIDDGVDRLFVPLVSHDGLAHAHGLQSSQRQEKLSELGSAVAALWARFLDQHKNARGVLISDHGMADVVGSVDVRKFDLLPRRGRRGLYTAEATLLRVWSDDAAHLTNLRRQLEASGQGLILSEGERTAQNLANRRFGDLIFVLDQGLTFVPCTMTKRTVSKAMHGYMPDNPEQWGVAASSAPLFAERVGASDVYRTLASLDD